eukprot:scaffold10434_cov72-Skeletonema_dohrnii-CCMP3373.AAC.2
MKAGVWAKSTVTLAYVLVQIRVVPPFAAEEYKEGGTALLLAAFLRGVKWWTWCWCSAWVVDMVQ